MYFINIPQIFAEKHELAQEPYVLISITDKESDKISHDFPNCKDILRLYFYDLEETIEGYDYNVFTKEIAALVREFIEKYKQLKFIFVQCHAGISRSAGIAAALNKFYNGKDKFYFDKYLPNKLCYRLMLEELQFYNLKALE